MVLIVFGNIVKECVLWYIIFVDNVIIYIYSFVIYFIVKSEINVKLLEIIINYIFVFLIILLKFFFLVIVFFKVMGIS